ncbi:MAG: thioredoxin family protein [Elusimicrobia bacterium]|nr:thioredoxin family protein [Elusimicrobiota bacterium]
MDDKAKDTIKKDLSVLTKKVKLIVFTKETECSSCKDSILSIEEVVSLSDNILMEKYDFTKDKEKAEQYNIDKTPAIAVVSDKDFGIRFYGFPDGLEFLSLLDAIKLVSSGESNLTLETREMTSKITKPVVIKVFTTVSCPYCPAVVKLANRFAVESDLIGSHSIIANEFPELVEKYSIFSVPKVMINETAEFEGVPSEKEFLENILRA